MSNRYEGDPKIIITENGWTLQYKGGQPVMDQGLENLANIALLTKPGWCGNIFLPQDSKIGSDLRDTAAGAITISKLNDIRQSAEKALKSKSFGSVTATVTNPNANYVKIVSLINPPGRDSQQIIIQQNGQNWINQADNPAYRMVT